MNQKTIGTIIESFRGCTSPMGAFRLIEEGKVKCTEGELWVLSHSVNKHVCESTWHFRLPEGRTDEMYPPKIEEHAKMFCSSKNEVESWTGGRILYAVFASDALAKVEFNGDTDRWIHDVSVLSAPFLPRWNPKNRGYYDFYIIHPSYSGPENQPTKTD